MDLTDANATGEHTPTAVHPQNEKPTRQVSIPVDRDARVYNMQHKRRGKAYIFNHDLFDASLNLSERVGSKTDVSNLERVLSQLDFEVSCFHNYGITSVNRKIKQLAEHDHTDNDCVVVIVLSHGMHGTIYASDSFYHFDDLWRPFTSDKCPSLAGKPKLFFIQACQGNKKDVGLTVQFDSNKMDSVAPQEYSIPTMADFMMAYSTIPGYVSWRNTENGSWFIEALCEIFKTYGREEDLLSMMTMVLLKVATLGRGYSQIPCVVSQLIRRVYFPSKPTCQIEASHK
ncbi:caspase-1-like isoform X2 [Daphnia carinata]|uniref:caspase-1-like isoform X2 n=1 Tax=Daphnia carinata TaxID=120202 RepID=UPI002580E6CF|nr:caspase-1-like isoform X2 [Daphnia carinata]